VQRPRGAQDVETVAAPHLEVAQHHVEIAVVQPFDRGVAVRRFFDVVASLGQTADQPPPQRIVIVSNENSTHFRLLLDPLDLLDLLDLPT
jgi:hypothetical protein